MPPRGALLSPAQAAHQLGVSDATLRRWAALFAMHLSEYARPGDARKRHYTIDDIAVLRRASDLLRRGKTPEEVDQILSIPPSTEEMGLDAPGGMMMADMIQEWAAARAVIQELVKEVRAGRAREEELQRKIDDLMVRFGDLEAYLRKRRRR